MRSSSRNLAKNFFLGVAAAAVVAISGPSIAQTLSYQGRLEEPATGAPKPDGTYAMTFQLYPVPTGGSPLWIETKNVVVTKGLFSSQLGDTSFLDPALFDGNDRWLGVTIGSDPEAVPRTLLAYSPYTFRALDAGTLNGFDETSFAAAGHHHGGADITSGTVADARIAPSIARDAEVLGLVTASDGTGSGLDADRLDGMDSGAFAPAGHGHDGADIVTGTVADARVATSITRDNEVMTLVTAGDGTGSGLDADRLDGLDSTSFSTATHDHDSRYLDTAGPDTMSGSSSNPILTVNQSGSGESIHASGDITASRLRYNAARSHHFSLPGEAFQPTSNIPYRNSGGSGGAYIDTTGFNSLAAPVYLPDGATITALSVFFNDLSGGDLTVALVYLNYSGGYTFLGEVNSTGTSGFQNQTDTTITLATVNNINGGYLIYAYSSAWDPGLKLMGVRITYTLSEAP